MFCHLCGPQNETFDNTRRFHIFNDQLFEWTGVLISKTSETFLIEMTPTIRPDDKQVLSFQPNGTAFSQYQEEAGSKITFIGIIKSASFQYRLHIIPKIPSTIARVNRTLTFNTYYTAFVPRISKRNFIFDRMYRGRRILLLGSFYAVDPTDNAFPPDIPRDINVPYCFCVYPHAMDGFPTYPDIRIIIQKDSADENKVNKHPYPAVFEIVAEFISIGRRDEDPVWMSLKKITSLIPKLRSLPPKRNIGGSMFIPRDTIDPKPAPKPVPKPQPQPPRVIGQDLSKMTKEQRSEYLKEEAKKEGLICPITKVLLVDPVRGRLVLKVDPNDPTEPPIATVSRAHCVDPQAVTDHNTVERLEEFKTKYADYLDDMFPKSDLDDALFD
ncbi:hypothetical protein BLNAU_15193 [Blattamonas nauphoetae]|uniref:Uncharacterized protein n=1 Tax=Blattamonas nauphoetae TaxID=2049346 RepID=A0ABQ9XF88_9EUKA|nr:hypothetical protein BLNAU_15193 [Blattamonas nauphoetae]